MKNKPKMYRHGALFLVGGTALWLAGIWFGVLPACFGMYLLMDASIPDEPTGV